MNQEDFERIEYMANTAKEVDIMLTIAPDAVLDLMDNLRASVELTAIREAQLLEERKEVERLKADGLMLDWIERQIGRPVSLLQLVIQDVMRGKKIREAIERARE